MKPVARFIGIQEGVGRQPAFELFNLLIDIEGHPIGSTVSRVTIEGAGYTCPQTAFNREAMEELEAREQMYRHDFQQAKREYYHGNFAS